MPTSPGRFQPRAQLLLQLMGKTCPFWMFPETCVVPCTFLIQPCTHHIAFRVTIIDYCKLSSGQMSLSNHQQWVSISLTLHTSTINLIENTKQAYTIYTCRQHIGTAIDNTIRYQMLMMAWPTELNCWCVAVSISLSSWCSCQYLHMVNVLTTPHLQSEHHSPGIDQRSLDRKQQKRNQQRQNDTHIKKIQETDCGG